MKQNDLKTVGKSEHKIDSLSLATGCEKFTDDFEIGFGFHKANKLTAVRQSLNVA